MGNRFWIEALFASLTIPDAAGVTTSAVFPLTKSGEFLGGSVSANNSATNDNVQAVGDIKLTDPTPSALAYGEFLDSITFRVTKLAGTAGATVYSVIILLFMRGRGSN